MIKPTVGRVVLYRPKDTDYDDEVRNAAIICKVIDDNTVNLAVFNEYGVSENEQNVHLVQLTPDEGGICKHGDCEWMPHDDLMARMLRLEELLTSDEVGLELPPLALKSPAGLPDNVTEIVKGDDTDPVDHTKPQPGDAAYQDNTLAENQAAGTEDSGSGSTSGPESGAIGDEDEDEVVTDADLNDGTDGTDEAADTATSTDDGASAEADDETEVDEESGEADAKAPGEAVA